MTVEKVGRLVFVSFALAWGAAAIIEPPGWDRGVCVSLAALIAGVAVLDWLLCRERPRHRRRRVRPLPPASLGHACETHVSMADPVLLIAGGELLDTEVRVWDEATGGWAEHPVLIDGFELGWWDDGRPVPEGYTAAIAAATATFKEAARVRRATVAAAYEAARAELEADE